MAYAIFSNSNIRKLEQFIDSEFELETIPVRIEPGASFKNCYINVQQKVETYGGRLQYGWIIIENTWMVEAEHHAVWEAPDGNLTDITPKPLPMRQVLFIPDDRLVYDGTPIDNVRLNTTENPVVDDFIRISEMVTYIIGSGERSSDFTVKLNSEANRLHKKYLEIGHIILKHFMSKRKSSSFCICSSGKRYNECHGRELKGMIEIDRLKINGKVVCLNQI